ncbi:hypothetical protein TKK_0008170 [Trichogramma kaykai]
MAQNSSDSVDQNQFEKKFEDFKKIALNVITNGCTASDELPCDRDFHYYKCYPTFNEIREKHTKRISNIMQCIVKQAGVDTNVTSNNINEKYNILLESNDILLNRAEAYMDIEQSTSQNTPTNFLVVERQISYNENNFLSKNDEISSKTHPATQTLRLFTCENVPKPQFQFKDKIENSYRPWKPRIKNKPNSITPLAIHKVQGEDGFEYYSHPYEFELNQFKPHEIHLQRRQPIKCKSIEETPLIIINDTAGLRAMVDNLKIYNEIAIDFKEHTYRTFQGIICLMQISTFDTDYIIDALTLRSELHVLNVIFTNTSILKVFHGSHSDICSLQRDLSLYVVNMFDTHLAAKDLQLPLFNLPYLLDLFCNINPDRYFQIVDWRVRPLPEELTKYAQKDIHYLLYLKDILRNALIDKDNGLDSILKNVFTNSTISCKKVYKKEVYTDNSYISMYKKSRKNFNSKQLNVLKELHKWRDETAREEDESYHMVLPDHMLIKIAETLPENEHGIFACCDKIPPLIRQNVMIIHKLISNARDQPFETTDKLLMQNNQLNDSNSWNTSSPDLISGMTIQQNLQCMLSSTAFNNSKTEMEKNLPFFVSPGKKYKLIPSTANEESVLIVNPFFKKNEDNSTAETQEETLPPNHSAHNTSIDALLSSTTSSQLEKQKEEETRNEELTEGKIIYKKKSTRYFNYTLDEINEMYDKHDFKDDKNMSNNPGGEFKKQINWLDICNMSEKPITKTELRKKMIEGSKEQRLVKTQKMNGNETSSPSYIPISNKKGKSIPKGKKFQEMLSIIRNSGEQSANSSQNSKNKKKKRNFGAKVKFE